MLTMLMDADNDDDDADDDDVDDDDCASLHGPSDDDADEDEYTALHGHYDVSPVDDCLCRRREQYIHRTTQYMST